MNRDLEASRAARDEGIERVVTAASEAFREGVKGYIRGLPSGWQGVGEDIRAACMDNGLEAHHPNAWGGIINGMVQSGFLEATGEYVPMQDERSHARKTAVLRRTDKFHWRQLV